MIFTGDAKMHGADFTTANNLFAFGAFFRSRSFVLTFPV